MVKEKESKTIEQANDLQAVKDSIVPGMTVRIYQKIKELNIKGQEKERLQYFEGIVIARKHGKEAGATITVSKISDGVKVEKIFPLNLPTITKIEIKKQSRVRRAKLYFLSRGYKKRLKTKTSKA
jgi:large subunit ribosomal protein L19